MMNKTNLLNRTQIVTIVVFLFIYFVRITGSAQPYSPLLILILQLAFFGVIIGAIGLIRGSMPGWSIHNRMTAAIVVFIGFLAFALLG